MAEVLRREFLAPVLTDVRLGPPGPGGDYDVLARLDDRLLYVEVKSSPPRAIYAPEVAAFLERSRALNPDIALFLVDTRLRMGDKIVPMFDEELRKLPGAPALALLDREICNVRGRLFVANSQPSVAANLAAVLRAYHAGPAAAGVRAAARPGFAGGGGACRGRSFQAWRGRTCPARCCP